MLASIHINYVCVYHRTFSRGTPRIHEQGYPRFPTPFYRKRSCCDVKKGTSLQDKKRCSHQRAGNQREEWLSTFEVSKVPGENVIVFQFSFFLENAPVTLSENMIAETRGRLSYINALIINGKNGSRRSRSARSERSLAEMSSSPNSRLPKIPL